MIADIIALVLSISLELGIDGNLSLALVDAENAGYNRIAVHSNNDGSRDLGIMQLNENSLHEFTKKHWKRDEPFDVFNAEHNIFIGLSHLKYLLTECGFNEWQAILAYNAGEYAVRSGKVPNSSIEYANKIFIHGGKTNDRREANTNIGSKENSGRL